MTFDSSTPEASADVSLKTNLFASQNVINLFHGDSSAFPMNFSAERNLFEAGRAVFNLQKQLKTLRTMVTWEGRDNSHAARDAFVLTSNPRSMGRIETLQDWYRQWSGDAEKSGSREVVTEFDPESAPSDQPGKPEPGDFRHLAKASGVPINLELVGPSGYQPGTEGRDEYRNWKKRCQEVFG